MENLTKEQKIVARINAISAERKIGITRSTSDKGKMKEWKNIESFEKLNK